MPTFKMAEQAPVPRHREIKESLCKLIKQQLGITSLFDNQPRTDASPSRPNESRFEYLDRCDAPVAEQQRTLLNQCYTRYPVTHQADILGRYRSKKAEDHYAAEAELLIHESLLRLGYAVTVHPPMSGTRNTPDFLVDTDLGSFYIEVKALDDRPFAETTPVETISRMIEAQLGTSPHHYIYVDRLQIGTAEIGSGAKKGLVELFNQLLSKPPEGILYGDYRAIDRLKVEEYKGWKVTRSTSAVVARHTDKAESTWQFRGRLSAKNEQSPIDYAFGGFSDSGPMDSRSVLRGAKRKAGRYGNPDHPMVLAIRTQAPNARLDIWEDMDCRKAFDMVWVSFRGLAFSWDKPDYLEILVNPHKQVPQYVQDTMGQIQAMYQILLNKGSP